MARLTAYFLFLVPFIFACTNGTMNGGSIGTAKATGDGASDSSRDDGTGSTTKKRKLVVGDPFVVNDNGTPINVELHAVSPSGDLFILENSAAGYVLHLIPATTDQITKSLNLSGNFPFNGHLLVAMEIAPTGKVFLLGTKPMITALKADVMVVNEALDSVDFNGFPDDSSPTILGPTGDSFVLKPSASQTHPNYSGTDLVTFTSKLDTGVTSYVKALRIRENETVDGYVFESVVPLANFKDLVSLEAQDNHNLIAVGPTPTPTPSPSPTGIPTNNASVMRFDTGSGSTEYLGNLGLFPLSAPSKWGSYLLGDAFYAFKVSNLGVGLTPYSVAGTSLTEISGHTTIIEDSSTAFFGAVPNIEIGEQFVLYRESTGNLVVAATLGTARVEKANLSGLSELSGGFTGAGATINIPKAHTPKATAPNITRILFTYGGVTRAVSIKIESR